jgi:putative phosphoesterase
MKIAIVSDIHDHIDNCAWFLQTVREHDVDHIFALGDYCSPFIITDLAALDTPIFAVWGNNDGDKPALIAAAQNNSHFTFAPRDFCTVTLDDKNYFLTHYPEIAEHAAKSLDFDAVFHGHTHQIRTEKIGVVPIINPGKISSYPQEASVTFAIFDTDTHNTQIITKN